MNTFASQQTPPLKKPDENNTKSIMEYLENNYNYLRNMEETQTKEKLYRTKNKKLKMWGNLLNQRKIVFFNAIKSEETAKTYKEFMKKD